MIKTQLIYILILCFISPSGTKSEIPQTSPELKRQTNDSLDPTYRINKSYEIRRSFQMDRTQVGAVKYVGSNLLNSATRSVLQIQFVNIGEIVQRPIVWAELYDKSDQYIGRFESEPAQIYPGTSAQISIDLSGVGNGSYKALVVGKYVSLMKSNDIYESVSLFKSIKQLDLFYENNQSNALVNVDENDDRNFNLPSRVPVRNSFDGEFKATQLNEVEVQPIQTEETVKIETVPTKKRRAPEIVEHKAAMDITLPDKNSQASSEVEDFEYYTVKKGDWLSTIARSFYGNPMKYTEIFSANMDILTNPDLILPGQKLKIPKVKHENVEPQRVEFSSKVSDNTFP